MTTGQKIHYYRKQNGMTLEELGKRCGVQKSVVAKWEKDLVDINTSRAKQIAEALGVSPLALFSDDEQNPIDINMLLKAVNFEQRSKNGQQLDRLLEYAKKLSQSDLDRLIDIAKMWSD